MTRYLPKSVPSLACNRHWLPISLNLSHLDGELALFYPVVARPCFQSTSGPLAPPTGSGKPASPPWIPFMFTSCQPSIVEFRAGNFAAKLPQTCNKLGPSSGRPRGGRVFAALSLHLVKICPPWINVLHLRLPSIVIPKTSLTMQWYT